MPRPSTTRAETTRRSTTSPVAAIERVLPAVLVACWAVLPFTVGTLVGDGVSGRSRAVQLVATAAAWMIWGVGLVAALVAHPVALTALRIVTPLATVVSLWWALTGPSDGRLGALGTGAAVASATMAFAAGTGQRHVNGPAYPNERRFLLRPPGLLLLGPLAIAWLVVVGGVLGGPLLLAAQAWVMGVVAILAGWVGAAVAARALHALSRRFAVFVPAGFVIHDLLTVRDPMLFPRNRVEAVRLAASGSDSLDLTQRALGFAVEVVLLDKAEIVLLRPGHRAGETGATARFLISPTLPGRLLTEARQRRYPA